MANSPAHALGEQIGVLLEQTTIDFIKKNVSCDEYYVDYRHPRVARGGAKEVTGTDAQGNKHKLDVVIERGGSEQRLGTPVAYIEVAWRRYVKHSKAKVQEISGAILPLVRKYKDNIPFQGAILAGDFTQPSRKQLESEGFSVLFIPSDTIRAVFKDAVNIKLEWEEDTPESKLSKLVERLVGLSTRKREAVKSLLLERASELFENFLTGLLKALNRRIESVTITPLHGSVTICETIETAVRFIQDYNEEGTGKIPLKMYQISIRYNTEDSVDLNFTDKMSAIRALNQFKDC